MAKHLEKFTTSMSATEVDGAGYSGELKIIFEGMSYKRKNYLEEKVMLIVRKLETVGGLLPPPDRLLPPMEQQTKPESSPEAALGFPSHPKHEGGLTIRGGKIFEYLKGLEVSENEVVERYRKHYPRRPNDSSEEILTIWRKYHSPGTNSSSDPPVDTHTYYFKVGDLVRYRHTEKAIIGTVESIGKMNGEGRICIRYGINDTKRGFAKDYVLVTRPEGKVEDK
jgi:hypothetical protein